jgi:hypothetical protein
VPLHEEQLFAVLGQLVDADQVRAKILQKKQSNRQQAKASGKTSSVRYTVASLPGFAIREGNSKAETCAQQAEQSIVKYTYTELPADINGHIPASRGFTQGIIEPGHEARTEHDTTSYNWPGDA